MPGPPAGDIPDILHSPQVTLIGDLEYPMVGRFIEQLADAERKGGDIAVQLTTLGGGAEVARRLVREIDDARRRIEGRFLFLGKTTVYSAGVTMMAAFPREDRFLTRDTMLLIHGRQLDKNVALNGAMRSSRPKLEALISEIDCALRLEDESYERLTRGSRISAREACEKGLHNWYLTGDEAEKLGLVAGII